MSDKPEPEPESASIARQILAASAAQPPMVASFLQTIAPVAKPLKYVLQITVDYVFPVYVTAFKLGYQLCTVLPVDLLSAAMGIGLSFCGGAYCASIAAMEAARMSGWEKTRAALLEIYDDCIDIYNAHVADEKRDDDGDGIPDVRQLDPQSLLTRKLAVYAMAVKDPERFATALGGLYTAWLAVQGVLRLEFAKTITLGVSIAELATPMLQRLSVPILAHLVPQPYHHWGEAHSNTRARRARMRPLVPTASSTPALGDSPAADQVHRPHDWRRLRMAAASCGLRCASCAAGRAPLLALDDAVGAEARVHHHQGGGHVR